jgi:hypothetical protein
VARSLAEGETVYVPRARLGLSVDAVSAFYRGTIVEKNDRSVRLGLPGAATSRWVPSSAIYRNIGVCVYRIGDFETETALLDPLTKSVHQYLRLLLPDDSLVVRYLRSRKELERFWSTENGAYSHVVLIAHGRRDGIRFGLGGWTSGADLAHFFGTAECAPKNFISLCCDTGHSDFARGFSLAPVCASLLAPEDRIHGAIASQYCQTFLAFHLLHGETIRIAHRHARSSVPGGAIFNQWHGGALG